MKTLTTEEVKNITAETVVFDASLSTHLNKIKEISDALTAELNAYKAVAKEIAGYKDYTAKTFKVTNKPARTFQKDDFIETYGKDVYDSFMVLKDKLYVDFI